jgi:hypothetical protein
MGKLNKYNFISYIVPFINNIMVILKNEILEVK